MNRCDEKSPLPEKSPHGPDALKRLMGALCNVPAMSAESRENLMPEMLVPAPWTFPAKRICEPELPPAIAALITPPSIGGICGSDKLGNTPERGARICRLVAVIQYALCALGRSSTYPPS